MANVLEEYLVSLGFSVDGGAYAAFKGAVAAAEAYVDGLDAVVGSADGSVGGLGAAAGTASRKVDEFARATKGAGDAAGKSDKKHLGLLGTVKKLTRAYAAITAVVSGTAGAAFALINRNAEKLAQLDNLGRQLGATVSDLQRWGYMAEQAGSSAGAMASTLSRIRSTSRDAAFGVGEMASVYRRLGVSTATANGELRSSTDILRDVSARLHGMGQARAELFASKLGIDPTLLAALRNGHLAQAMADYDRMQAAFGNDVQTATEQAVRLRSEFIKMKTLGGLLWSSVAAKFFAPLSDSLRDVRRYIVENADDLKGVLYRAVERVRRALRAVLTVARGVYAAFKSLLRLIGYFPPWVQKVAAAVGALGVALMAFGKKSLVAFATNPITWLVAAVAGLLLILDDLFTYMDGGEAYFGWGPIIGSAKELFEVLDAMKPVLLALGGAWVALVGVPTLVSGITAAFTALEGAIGLVTAAVAANPIGAALLATAFIVFLLIRYWDDLKVAVGKACDWIAKKWGATGKVFREWVDNIGAWFKALPDKIMDGLRGLKARLVQAFQDAIDAVKSILPDWVKWLLNIDGARGPEVDMSSPIDVGGGVQILPDGTVSYQEPEETPGEALADGIGRLGRAVSANADAIMAAHATVAPGTSTAPLSTTNVSTITNRGGDVDQSVHVKQDTQIIVEGAPSAVETADRVGRTQERSAKALARNIRSPMNPAPVGGRGW